MKKSLLVAGLLPCLLAAVSCRQMGQEANASALPSSIRNFENRDAAGKITEMGIRIPDNGAVHLVARLPQSWTEMLGADSLLVSRIPASSNPEDIYAVPHYSIRLLADAGEMAIPEGFVALPAIQGPQEQRWIAAAAPEWNGHAFKESLLYGRNANHVFMELLISQPWLTEMNGYEKQLPFSRNAVLQVRKEAGALVLVLK